MEEKKAPYPKSVFFIVSNEFCERFSYYGMRTILILYLRNILLYSENDSKIIYHAFTMLVYFFPLIGAIISDSWLGKFRTILYLSMVYSAGNIVLSLAAAEPIGLPQIPFSLIGLLLVAIGTGGIKPCVSAFGGDQFILPQQEHQLDAFFSMFYFAINAGSLISTFLTPVLREDVHCFENDSCFPLAFGVPGVLMIVSIVIFVAGKPLYKIRKPEGNVVLKVVSCIWCGIKEKFKSEDQVEHWLDRAEPECGMNLVYDVKRTLKVLVLFVPLPIFWALYDQQGSGWTFQATRMNGDIGFYTILPDQMQVVNPLLILLFIPLFTYAIYPWCARCNLLRTPLQRMVCGGLLAAASFVISAGLSFALEQTYPVLPDVPATAQVRLYNGADCAVKITAEPYLVNVEVAANSYKHIDLLSVHGVTQVPFKIEGCPSVRNKTGNDFRVAEMTANLYFITDNDFIIMEDNVDKDSAGLPKVRTLVNDRSRDFNLTYTSSDGKTATVSNKNVTLQRLTPGTYTLENSQEPLHFALGGVYTVLVSASGTNGTVVSKVSLYEITKPNSVHILWLLPQYVVITAAEIMFSITGLEFAYSEAPISMKSVLTAAWLLTTAVGNLIIVIIESAKIFEKQSHDFLLYAALMVLDVFVFAFMAVKYKYIRKSEETSISEEFDTRTFSSEDKSLDNPAFKHNDEA